MVQSLDFRIISEIGVEIRTIFYFSGRFYVIIGFGFLFFSSILHSIVRLLDSGIHIKYCINTGIRIFFIGGYRFGIVLAIGFIIGGIISSTILIGGIRRITVEVREDDIKVETNAWRRTFIADFPRAFLKSLPLRAPTSQLTPVQCCTYCSPIMATGCNVDLLGTRAAA